MIHTNVADFCKDTNGKTQHLEAYLYAILFKHSHYHAVIDHKFEWYQKVIIEYI